MLTLAAAQVLQYSSMVLQGEKKEHNELPQQDDRSASSVQ